MKRVYFVDQWKGVGTPGTIYSTKELAQKFGEEESASSKVYVRELFLIESEVDMQKLREINSRVRAYEQSNYTASITYRDSLIKEATGEA